MSATRDSTLTDSQQLVADLRHQLAECRAERDEALEYQTVTAEVLGVIDSSPVRAGSRLRPPSGWGRAGGGVTPRSDPW
jgi:hypothetical protein